MRYTKSLKGWTASRWFCVLLYMSMFWKISHATIPQPLRADHEFFKHVEESLNPAEGQAAPASARAAAAARHLLLQPLPTPASVHPSHKEKNSSKPTAHPQMAVAAAAARSAAAVATVPPAPSATTAATSIITPAAATTPAAAAAATPAVAIPAIATPAATPATTPTAAVATATVVPAAVGTKPSAATAAQQLPAPTASLPAAPPAEHTAAQAADNLLLSPPLPGTAYQAVARRGFVKRTGHQLTMDGKPFYFLGFNAYWMIDKAVYYSTWGRKQLADFLKASSQLGLSVGRCWAFNSGMPLKPGVYDEKQFEGLDFIIYAAGKYNLRLILALGNLWSAYKGPEDFMYLATGSADHKDILDFYTDPATKQLFKSHISTIVNRVNTYTGVKYKDDPTIMGFDVMNEPRCPGCLDTAQQSLVHGWMIEMMAHLHATDPNHLVTMGTEGFFMAGQNNLNLFNPGAGAQCEGEDWVEIGQLPGLDFTTLHVYERHMERIPVPPVGRSYATNPDWMSCDFTCYVNWLVRYLQAHMEVSDRDIGKPIVLEEFGLTWWRMELSDRKVLLEVVYQLVAQSKARGGALAGAMLWNAADNTTSDQDGYNIRVDPLPKPITTPPPPVHMLGPLLKLAKDYNPNTTSTTSTSTHTSTSSHASSAMSVLVNDSEGAVTPRKAQTMEDSHPGRRLLDQPMASNCTPQQKLQQQQQQQHPFILPDWTSEKAPSVSLSPPMAAMQPGRVLPPWTVATTTSPAQAVADISEASCEQPPCESLRRSLQQLTLVPLPSPVLPLTMPDPADDAWKIQPGPTKRDKFLTVLAPATKQRGLHAYQRAMELGNAEKQQVPQQQQQQQQRGEEGEKEEAAADAAGFPRLSNDLAADGAAYSSNSGSNGDSSLGAASRQLLYQQRLDGFRRGWQRGSCAHEASKTWRPPPLNMTAVDVQAHRQYCAPLQEVDIIHWGAKQLAG